MSQLQSCLYVGDVGHRRIAPVKHELHYRVYDLFIDVDELSGLNGRFKFLSYNRFNLFSIADKKFGAGDGKSISEHVWGLVKSSPCADDVKRIFMLCYPAVLGRVFNPLTTYYCYDGADRLAMMIYEVSNTFGGRHSYVIPIGNNGQQSHAKKFYVSPFNAVEGDYDFSVQAPGEELKLGITLRVAGKPVLLAWFSGERRELNDFALLRSFFSLPLLPLKVVAGIHWEALKLLVKGMKLVTRPPPLSPNVSFAKNAMMKKEQEK